MDSIDDYVAGRDLLNAAVTSALSRGIDGNFRLFVDVSKGKVSRVQVQTQEDVCAKNVLDEIAEPG